MRRNRGCRARIIAPTKDDAIDACINGPSGLKSIDDQVQFHPSRAGGAVVEWPNGSIARVLGMDAPKDVDRLRAAGNRELDWWEEMAAIRHLENAWDQAKLGLRSGTRRHSIASTTPKATPGYRKIRSLPGTVIVKASMYDNPYLPQDFIDEIEALYANTRLGKQEVHGLLLEDVEGAYWSLELLETTRWNQPAPEWSLVVTAVDPSGSTAGDATGIVTVAADARGIPFVIGDDTTQGTPEHRYRTAVMAAYRHRASVILFEDTYGGDNIGSNLRSAWDAAVQRGDIPDGVVKPRIMPTSKLKPRLKGNKADRAGVIAALYEQHSQGTERVWHLPGLAKLEDEQTTWEAESDWSANRLDALAWGVRYHTRHIGRVSQPVDAEAALNSFAQGFGGGTSPFGNSGSLGRR
jgi:phage terminase large subunit-like protein